MRERDTGSVIILGIGCKYGFEGLRVYYYVALGVAPWALRRHAQQA